MATESIGSIAVPRLPSRALVTTRARRRRRILFVALAMIVSWPLLAWTGARMLVVRSDMAQADAIVVLSGSSTYVERADWAAKLFREGRAPKVILTNDRLMSGWSHADNRNLLFYELASRELQQRGVPAGNILVISDIGAGTFQESLKIRDYADSHQLKRILIVTSGYHSRRALWSMQHAATGSDLQIGIDGPPPGWQTPAPVRWWLSRWGWKVVAGEYVKMVYYRLNY